MADRGNSIKKQRIRPMKMVTVGTMNRSISIRAAEIWYCEVMSAAEEEVFIFFYLQRQFSKQQLWEQHLAAIFAAAPVKYTGMQAEAAPTGQKFFLRKKLAVILNELSEQLRVLMKFIRWKIKFKLILSFQMQTFKLFF